MRHAETHACKPLEVIQNLYRMHACNPPRTIRHWSDKNNTDAYHDCSAWIGPGECSLILLGGLCNPCCSLFSGSACDLLQLLCAPGLLLLLSNLCLQSGWHADCSVRQTLVHEAQQAPRPYEGHDYLQKLLQRARDIALRNQHADNRECAFAVPEQQRPLKNTVQDLSVHGPICRRLVYHLPGCIDKLTIHHGAVLYLSIGDLCLNAGQPIVLLLLGGLKQADEVGQDVHIKLCAVSFLCTEPLSRELDRIQICAGECQAGQLFA